MRASPADYTPQFSIDRRPLLMWSALAVITLVVIGSIIAAPVLLARGHTVLAPAIYSGFSHLCHQLSDRSFFIAGHQFAVCARCTGIYAGLATATLAYPLCRSVRRTDTPPRKWLFIATVPLVIDFALGYFGILENTHLSRFITGALLGSVAVFYVVPGFIDLSLKNWLRVFRRNAVSSN